MRRREVITLLGGAAAGWPVGARAQQSAVPLIGYLTPAVTAERLSQFRRSLSELGLDDGRNVAIELRSADGRLDRLPAMAADLVRRPVTMILAGGTAAALAAKAATRTIPIVFFLGGDPVELGLVASLSHPGGNVTGFTTLGVELGAKRLELLHETLPSATVVAHLVNSANPALSAVLSRDAEAAARRLGFRLHALDARTEREIETAFVTAVEKRADGLVIGADAFFNSRGAQLGALSSSHRVPTIYQFRDFVAAGGLMSYGGSIPETYRHLAAYTARVLKGAKPADLPVQQFSKVELIINLKAAKALGLEVPPTLLARADEVIE